MEIVYGHRRTEAAKQCGWNTVSAIVDPISGLESLVQAIVENLQRDDMNPVDIGDALVELRDWLERENKNNSERAIGKIIGKNRAMVHRWIGLTEETDTTQSIIGRHKGGGKVTHKKIADGDSKLIMSKDAQPITETHVRSTREAGIKTPEEREAILVKASEEGLTYRETREVADAYKAAEELENAELLQEEILSMPVKGKTARHILNVAEVDARAKQRDTSFRGLIEEQEAEEKEFAYREKEYDALVADYLRMVKELGEAINAVSDGIEYGKFDRIAAQFTISKNIELIEKLDDLNGELRNVR
jgi:ParB-like chromosome segregation protein Spo0J